MYHYPDVSSIKTETRNNAAPFFIGVHEPIKCDAYGNHDAGQRAEKENPEAEQDALQNPPKSSPASPLRK